MKRLKGFFNTDSEILVSGCLIPDNELNEPKWLSERAPSFSLFSYENVSYDKISCRGCGSFYSSYQETKCIYCGRLKR